MSAPVAMPSASAPAKSPPLEDDTTGLDLLAGTIDADTPPAPCDYSRNYRGTVGKSPWSVILSRKGSALEGHVAYDAGGGELDVRGTVRPDGTITFEESKDGKTGGQIEGQCAPDTGIISGTWKLGPKSQPFVLKPRGAKGTPLFERRRVIGAPQEEDSWCYWDVRNPLVFGLGDAERSARINAHLRIKFHFLNEAEAERIVTKCPKDTSNQVRGYYSIEANEQGLLSVLENGYVYLGPAVHGDFTAAAAAISIDVPTGRSLVLTDIVTSSKALRPVVKSCMKFLVESIGDGDEWWFERDIQGVPADKDGEPVEETAPTFVPSSLHEPSFLVLPEGLAVLIRGQPTVSSYLEMQGPVIQWGALVRASILKTNSPVARLWAGVKPLGPSDPSCVRFLKPKWATPVKPKK